MGVALLNNDDIASEVLSRLPAKTLIQFKCVCKKWKTLISDPFFLRLHYQRCNDITAGFFFQESLPCKDMDIETVNYISVDKEPSTVHGTILDFLPEKVVLLASCNGLLCCRSCVGESNEVLKRSPYYFSSVRKESNFTKELVVYICNPETKEWIALRPDDGCHVGEGYGLACYPFSSSSNSSPSFKLVKIRPLRSNPNMCSFVIYSSETQSWRTSKEVCKVNSNFFANRMIFVNGRFHWLTWNHHIITFDVEQELAQVIKLPGITPVSRDEGQVCIGLGESEGCFHYVCAYALELQVWILKNFDKPEWVLKYSLPLKEFCQEHSTIFDTSMVLLYAETDHFEYHYNPYLNPLVFHDEVLFMVTGGSLLSYDFKSRTLVNYCSAKQLGDFFMYHPTVLPYSFSLASLYNFRSCCC